MTVSADLLSFEWVIIWLSFFSSNSKLIIILSFSKTFEFQLTGHWHCKHKAVFGSGSTLKFTSFIKILSFDWVGFYWKIPLSFEWVIIWVSYFFRAFGTVLSYDWVIIWPNYDCSINLTHSIKCFGTISSGEQAEQVHFFIFTIRLSK